MKNYKCLIQWGNGRYTEAAINCSSQEKAWVWANSLCKKRGGVVVEIS